MQAVARAVLLFTTLAGLNGCGDHSGGANEASGPSATLVAGPVVQPAVALPVVPPVAVATAPTPSVPGEEPDVVRAAWLAGPLTGRDNSMARHREARITQRADGSYEVYVKNQFAFRCTLSFGPDGRPALFERCRSGEAGWRASPASIPVGCIVIDGEERCEGPYRLMYPSSGGSPAALRIVRVLAP